MSEQDKLKRIAYKRRRRALIIMQAVIAVLLAVVILSSSFVYYQLNKTFYIDYTETGDVSYKVYLENNEFYDEEYLQNQSYVASLIDKIVADMRYELNIDAAGVEYEYSYGINANIIIKNDDDQSLVLDKEYIIKENQIFTETSNKISINESVEVDFDTYNDFAKKFFNDLKLVSSEFESYLLLTLNVKVNGTSASFEGDTTNNYDVMLSIPLASDLVLPETSTTIPSGENRVLACKGAINTDIFKYTAIGAGILEAIVLLILIAFVFLTRNDDINYNIKIKRLENSYKSFIQRITNEFDTEGYQILFVKTFKEMLSIRDTIQSPVLMSENADQTKTQFLIPTNTKILYVFEIKVDNYDQIYGVGNGESFEDLNEDESSETADIEESAPVVAPIPVITEQESTCEAVGEMSAEPETAEEAPAEETVLEESAAKEAPAEEATIEEAAVEEAVVEETPAEEAVAEEAPIEAAEAEENAEICDPVDEIPEVQEDASEAVTEEIPADVDEIAENDVSAKLIPTYVDGYGNELDIRYSRSVTANIIQADDQLKLWYSELKNYILSHKGVKSKISWKFDTFSRGRDQLVKLKTRGKTLLVYFNLKEQDVDMEKYNYEYNETKLFADTPIMVKVKSNLGLRRAQELVDLVMENFGIEDDPKAKTVDYVSMYPYEENEPLIERRLIKVLQSDINNRKVAKEKVAEEITEAPVEEAIPTVEEEEYLVPPKKTLFVPAEIEIEHQPTSVTEIVEVVADSVSEEEIIEVVANEPNVELSEIDYDDEVDASYEETTEKPGVEVIGVVWPEKTKHNKIYRYDPSGEVVNDGDLVIVPTRDVHKNREVIRKAAVAHGNHKIDPDSLTHPLKKIIGVIKHSLEKSLTPSDKKVSDKKSDKKKK